VDGEDSFIYALSSKDGKEGGREGGREGAREGGVAGNVITI